MADVAVNLLREMSRYVVPPLSASGGTFMTGPSALASLIGRTRARVLAAIGAAAGPTTTEIARRLRISPASASEHAYALRAAGLIRTERAGTGVAHRITPLGRALLGGAARTFRGR
jgi:DNA-binding MarR family transcriptional regulator